MIFEPGFSTAEQVTETSGRGVGMDIVRRNIEALHGRVEIESEEGQGATFTIRLPLTLAIIEGFSVGVGSEVYVLPIDPIVECVELPAHSMTGKGRSRRADLARRAAAFHPLAPVCSVLRAASRERTWSSSATRVVMRGSWSTHFMANIKQ